MKTAQEMVDLMAMLGVRLEARGETLHVKSHRNLLSPELLRQLKYFKLEIIAIINESQKQ